MLLGGLNMVIVTVITPPLYYHYDHYHHYQHYYHATIITTAGLKNDNVLNDDSRFGMVVIKLFTICFFIPVSDH